jgi:hypothetical protein
MYIIPQPTPKRICVLSARGYSRLPPAHLRQVVERVGMCLYKIVTDLPHLFTRTMCVYTGGSSTSSNQHLWNQ